VKAGKTCMTLEPGEEVVRPAPVPAKPECLIAFRRPRLGYEP